MASIPEREVLRHEVYAIQRSGELRARRSSRERSGTMSSQSVENSEITPSQRYGLVLFSHEKDTTSQRGIVKPHGEGRRQFEALQRRHRVCDAFKQAGNTFGHHLRGKQIA